MEWSLSREREKSSVERRNMEHGRESRASVGERERTFSRSSVERGGSASSVFGERGRGSVFVEKYSSVLFCFVLFCFVKSTFLCLFSVGTHRNTTSAYALVRMRYNLYIYMSFYPINLYLVN
ncbi:hypothetical protein LguiA_018234 [Lonicera macranthoides]